MNIDDKTVRLLDAAVPPIPPRLRTPPYERIRSRARRRRMARTASVAVSAAVLAIGLAAAAVNWPRRGPAPSGPPPTATVTSPPPTATAPGIAVSIQEARVDRAGTGLTVYVNSPGDCLVYGDPSPDVSETDATVRLVLRATSVPTECSRAMVATASVGLSRPLGHRTLLDGVTGNPVPAFPDGNLPLVPAPWAEVHTDFTSLDGTTLTVLYTRPGGPDLVITASRGGGLDPSPVQRIQLGHHQGVIVAGGPSSYEVDWMFADLLYQIRLLPSEGQAVSLAQIREVISELGWA